MPRSILRKTLLAASATAFLATLSLPAQAYYFDFDNPAWTGHWDTSVSAGAMWRVEGRDSDLAANGTYADLQAQGIPSQIDKNDGDNNFDKGLASLVYKVTSSLNLSWNNKYGVVVSGTYFYDQRIMNGERDGGYNPNAGCELNPLTGTQTGYHCTQYPDNSSGSAFSDYTERYAGSYGRMLDTYVWGDFRLGNMPLTVQFGRQVINWGEALFTIGGVNTANYYDVNALRLPGAKLREALLPLDSLYFNIGLTRNLSAQAFYQFDWKPNFAPPVGSYWSVNDSYPAHGANHVLVDGEAEGAAGSYAFSLYNKLQGGNQQLQKDQVALDRLDNDDPKDSGQFGFALKYLATDLNYTNFSFYFTNTHAKIPVVGAVLGNAGYSSTHPAVATACGGNPTCVGAVNAAAMIDSTKYFMVYPEDIQMYGFSFNTSVGKLALSGEIAYRPKRYIVNEHPDNLIAGVASMSALIANGTTVPLSWITHHAIRTAMGGDVITGLAHAGETYYFYDTVQSYTGSLVGIYTFGPMLGANNVIAVMEVGAEHLVGLDGDLHYASTASVLQYQNPVHPADTSNMEGSKRSSNPYSTYLDATSWGYDLVLQASYSDLIPKTTFKPSIRFSHDVHGNSAVGGNYMEGRKAATLSLDFVIKNRLTLSIAGSDFWGADYSNKLADRGNVTAAVGYSF